MTKVQKPMENQTLAATELNRQTPKNQPNKGGFLLRAWHPLEALWRGRHSSLGKGKRLESHKMQRARTERGTKARPYPCPFPIALQLVDTGLVLKLGELYLSFFNGLATQLLSQGRGWGVGCKLMTVPLAFIPVDAPSRTAVVVGSHRRETMQ